MTRLRGRLRQRRFPQEFRIPPGIAYRVRDGGGSAPPAAGPLPDADAGHTGLPDSTLADLATHLWRLARKLGQGRQEGEAFAGQRLAGRHLRAAQEALAEAGVETQDHDGAEYHFGLSLHVLAYQPTPGATRETVLETVRPSVYRDGRQIQIGHVIVAQPEGDREHGPRDR